MERKDFEDLAIALLRAIKPEDLDAVLTVQPRRGPASQIPVDTEGQDEKPAATNIYKQMAESIRASIGRRPNHMVVKPENLGLLMLAANEARDKLERKHRKATMRVAELAKTVEGLQAERDAWMAKARGLESAEQAKPAEASRMTVADWAAAQTIDWSQVRIAASSLNPSFSFAPNGQPVLSVSPDGLFTWADNAAELIERTTDGATRAILRVLWTAKPMGGREAQLEAQCSVLVARMRGMQRKLAKQGQTIAQQSNDMQRMEWMQAEMDKAVTERHGMQQRVDNCLRLADQQQERIADLELERDAYKAAAEAFKAEKEASAQQVDAGAYVAQLQQRITELERQLREMTRSRDSHRAALDEWLEKTEWVQRNSPAAELGQHRADVMRERLLRLQRIVDGWDANMAWARDGRFNLCIGTHLGEFVRQQFEAMQRRRDELSQRLADEQQQCFTVNPLDGVGAMTMQRYCRHFSSNLGTPVKLSAHDALRVFELAIKALDQPGELAEAVRELRRHAAQVQSTAERLTQLPAKK